MIQEAIEAKRLMDKYNREQALGICRQRQGNAKKQCEINAKKGNTERTTYWRGEAGYWSNVEKAIESEA